MNEVEIIEIDNAGSGEHASALLVIADGFQSEEQARKFCNGLCDGFRVFVVKNRCPGPKEVRAFAEKLAAKLEETRLRRLTVFGISDGTNVSVAVTRILVRSVRRLALLNATSRVSPSLFDRVLDRVERFFPFGLPLKKLSQKFDARPFLHRIHCPTLVLISANSTSFVQAEGERISQRIPNAWLEVVPRAVVTSGDSLSAEVVNSLQTFLQVPVKRPQKGEQRAVA